MYKNIHTTNKTKGFTLVELLIVLAIIALLATISIFGIQGAREAARDSQRKADLEAIRSALEIHRADCDAYPNNLGVAITGSLATCSPSGNTYMQEVPQDPFGAPYAYSSTGQTYTLCSTLEDPPSPSNNTSGCGSCGSAGSCQFRVQSP